MTPAEKIENKIHHAIDDISNSVKVNGCESDTTEFLLNFLTNEVPNIVKLMLEKECDDAANESADDGDDNEDEEDDLDNLKNDV